MMDTNFTIKTNLALAWWQVGRLGGWARLADREAHRFACVLRGR
jgi:hypothetical protein